MCGGVSVYRDTDLCLYFLVIFFNLLCSGHFWAAVLANDCAAFSQ